MTERQIINLIETTLYEKYIKPINKAAESAIDPAQWYEDARQAYRQVTDIFDLPYPFNELYAGLLKKELINIETCVLELRDIAADKKTKFTPEVADRMVDLVRHCKTAVDARDYPAYYEDLFFQRTCRDM